MRWDVEYTITMSSSGRRTGAPRWSAALFAVATLTAWPLAAAPRRGARLAWARTEEAERCINAQSLQEDVIARLGWNPFVLPRDLEMEGTMARTRTGYRADLRFRDATGQPLGRRTLESREPTCRDLGEAVAVAITVAIDPDAVPTRPATDKVEPEPPPPSPPPAEPAHPGERRPRVRVSLMGGAGAGVVPDLAAVTSIRVGALVHDHIEIGLGSTLFHEADAAGLGFSLTSGELRGCLRPGGGGDIFRICATFLAGLFSSWVQSPDLAPIEVGAFPWFAGGGGPALSLPVAGRLRLELMVEAFVPFTRRQAFVRAVPEPVWEQSTIAGRGEVGVGALF
jgi:hypothetical protein